MNLSMATLTTQPKLGPRAPAGTLKLVTFPTRPSPLPSCSQDLYLYLIPTTTFDVGIIVFYVLQIRKLRLREAK